MEEKPQFACNSNVDWTIVANLEVFFYNYLRVRGGLQNQRGHRFEEQEKKKVAEDEQSPLSHSAGK